MTNRKKLNKKKKKSNQKKMVIKRVTPEEAKSNREDKIRNFKFFILTINNRKTIWNEVQVHFCEGKEEQKRTQGRLFGLVYVSKIKKTFNVIVVDNLTSAGLDLSLVELIDKGKEGTTGSLGAVSITSYVTYSATFAATHPDYLENEVMVVVTESITEYTITIRLTHI
jgi:hypothetical protein